MKTTDPSRLGALVADALSRVGRRGIWQSGWGDIRLDGPRELNSAPNPRIFVTGELPHQWLFGRVAAVVHHGGAGTTAATLQAGVPSVVVPHAFDQPFWGRRIESLGCGPAPIDFRDLTSGRLAAALRAALEDDRIRASAAQLGETVRGEDGTGRAVECLERWMKQ
jgi:sterol 3beta-glucosyltransferase